MKSEQFKNFIQEAKDRNKNNKEMLEIIEKMESDPCLDMYICNSEKQQELLSKRIQPDL